MMVETLAVLAVLLDELAQEAPALEHVEHIMPATRQGSAPTMTGRRNNGHSSGKITVWVSRSATPWQ